MSSLNSPSCRSSLGIVIFILILIYCDLFSKLKISSKNSNHIHQQTNSTRIFYVVRTTSNFYHARLIYILETWLSLVDDDYYFVSNTALPNISQNHMILTEETCGVESHSMSNLCCKTGHEFLIYQRYISKYDWFCHFDDDQYVNVNKLKLFLSTLDKNKPYYIGRPSWAEKVKRRKNPFPYPFWFATLGAGVCLSKRTVYLLRPFTRTPSEFVDGCIHENYYDDIYLGFILSGYLNITLTQSEQFHSHLERSIYKNKLTFLRTFTNQITFGFRMPDRYPKFLPQLYPPKVDPYRMRALHCLLNTEISECQTKIQQYLFNSTK